MAENPQDAGLNIEVNAVANKKSAEQAVNELASGVQQASKKGRIEVPVDITVPIDDTKKKLTEAQKDITSEISKMMTKGFSASGKDIDTLTSKFKEFTKTFDSAGKGRQNKIFREIRKQVEEIQKSYKSLQETKKSTQTHEPKIKRTTSTKKSNDTTKKTASDRYLEKQEQYSKRAQGAGKRTELKKELAEVRENKSPIKSSGNIKASMTNDQLMRLSEYSAHGSNWANELARVLKEEVAKSAKTLVTYIDPSYAKKTKDGRATTEKEFLTDTIKNIRTQLKDNITKLEAGSEDITLDTLKEQAAVIKVLNKALGKTTEDAEKAISSAIQSIYSSSTTKRLGGTNLEDGQEKGVGPGHENAQQLIKKLYESMKQWDSEVFADNIAKELILGTEKIVKNSESKRKRISSESQAMTKVSELKSTDTYKAELAKLNSATNKTFDAVRNSTKATEKQTNYDKIENVAERVADNNEQKISKQNSDINRDVAKAVKSDAVTGFNTNSKTDELIELVRNILSILSGDKPKTPSEKLKLQEPKENTTVKELWQSLKNATNITPEQRHRMLADKSNEEKNARKAQDTEIKALPGEIEIKPPKTSQVKEPEEPYKNRVEKSNIYASPFRQGFWKKLEGAFESLTGVTRDYEKVLKANADEQDKMAAERIKTYGLNNGRNPNDTGDIAGMRRILQLYRTNKASIEQNPELAQKIKLTPGRDIDTTELTKALNKALSGKNMRNAQMGGSIPRQILGAMTGFIGMPSLEKSRAQADGLNQILGNINKALQSVLINIQTKETELAGMEARGDVKFNKEGYIEKGTSAAYKTLADLEEEKLVLDSIKADLLANDEIIKRTGGRFSSLVKNLNYTSPVLKENNGILRNINSGLDKNGKALKFQTRMAEILNYTFQLMSRSIGQMIKNWLTMLNPINLIKKAFSDFGSYDTKWQRTMNVIKINFQRIIKPAMEWIAQKLVNIIGFFDIISMKIQEAFGQIPISLFDQAGAESEQIRRNLEEAANVTLGFDELHDIGTDQSGANDLMGDIYKPQLSQEWIDLANEIGDLFAGIITGDLGFGEAMVKILGIAWEGIQLIGKEIWNAIKNSTIGQYIEKNWKNILATLLAIFVGWKLLKVAGSMLAKALFGGLSGSTFGTFLSSLGTKFTTWISSAFTGSALEGTMVTAGTSLGQVFAVAFVSILAFVLGKALADWGAETLKSNTDYNQGLMDGGGDPDDKKSNVGGTVATIGASALAGTGIGAAIGSVIPGVGTAIGAGIGTLIGGIAGTVRAVLVPAFKEAEIAARNMNNEMQNIEYYEGKVQAAKTKVDELDELMQMSNDTIEAQKDKVYELGEKYGVSSEKMNELVRAIENGNYNTELAAGLNDELATALETLDYHYGNNTELTNKLAEAKRKLAREELELSITSDISAGNFELATARIEYAMAAGLYTTDEAAAKMAQIMKETSYTEGQELLSNVSPELQKKWYEYTDKVEQGKEDMATIFGKMSDDERTELLKSNNEDLKKKWITYATTTEQGKKDLAKIYSEMNEEERKAFEKDYSGEAGSAMSKAIDAMQSKINSASWDWSHPFKSLDSMFTGDWSWKAKYASFDVGTNYVPNDGFAYIHKGEAIIPKDENVFARQGKAWDGQMAMNSQMMNAITRLEQTISQGINVKGEFRQRGNDLVATVEKAKNRNGNQPLNNSTFAR